MHTSSNAFLFFFQRLLPATLACAMSLLLAACAGNGLKITEGNQGDDAPAMISPQEAYIVHVDRSNSIATIRVGDEAMEEGFYIARDRANDRTAVLKTTPGLSGSGLQTAEVLQGEPDINDTVKRPSSSEIDDLKAEYTNSAGDSD